MKIIDDYIDGYYNHLRGTAMRHLMERLDYLESMILVYSERDQERTKELIEELDAINMEILDIMST